jgi:hypothetical protein
MPLLKINFYSDLYFDFKNLYPGGPRTFKNKKQEQ